MILQFQSRLIKAPQFLYQAGLDDCLNPHRPPLAGKVINQGGNFINVDPELNPFKSDPFTTRPTTRRPRPNNSQRPNNRPVVEEFPVENHFNDNHNNNNNNNQFNDPFNQPLSFGRPSGSNENPQSEVFNPFGVELDANSDQVSDYEFGGCL